MDSWPWANDEKISDQAKLVTIFLLDSRNPETGVCDSEETLRNRLGWSKRKIERAVCAAEEAELIKIVRVRGERNEYFFPLGDVF